MGVTRMIIQLSCIPLASGGCAAWCHGGAPTNGPSASSLFSLHAAVEIIQHCGDNLFISPEFRARETSCPSAALRPSYVELSDPGRPCKRGRSRQVWSKGSDAARQECMCSK